MSERARLPDRRSAETFEVEFIAPGTGQPSVFIVSIGADPADPREVFVQGTGQTKPASVMADMLRDAAIIISVSLQHGVSIEALRASLTREDGGAPSSPIGAVLDAIGGAE